MHIHDRELVQLLKNLIEIPSWVDYPNRSGYTNENKLLEYVSAWLSQKTAIDIKFQKLPNGRKNLIAKKGNPEVLYLAHADTVKPFNENQLIPKIINNKIYGRGAVDMKSGLAAMMQAISRNPKSRNFWFLIYSDEEFDFLGMKNLTKELKNIKPKYIISCDGNDLRISYACRGLIEFRIQVIGKAGHAAKDNGVSAIKSCMILISQLNEKLSRFNNSDLGKTNINIAYIKGGKQLGQDSFKRSGELINVGERANIIPDICEMLLDIRPSSNMVNFEMIKEFIKLISHQNNFKFKILKVNHNYNAWLTDKKYLKPFISIQNKIIGKNRGLNDPNNSGYLDFQMLWEKLNKPIALAFGGGNGILSHTEDENISIKNLIKTRDFYSALLNKLN